MNNVFSETVSEVAFLKLEQSVEAALEVYSNVHRGSGQKSVVSTILYDRAKQIVLDYLDLDKNKYAVIFCSPERADAFTAQLKAGSFRSVTAAATGLPLGITAVAVKRSELPPGPPYQSGGGTTRLVSGSWIVWSRPPDRFEAGTPSIINAIIFARALQLIRVHGRGAFTGIPGEQLTANGILFHDDLENYRGGELLEKLRESMVGIKELVPSAAGPARCINLDNGASTPAFLPVLNAFLTTLRQTPEVRKDIITSVRSVCSEALDAPATDYDVLFTSNTTEAINLIARGLNQKFPGGSVVVNTIMEHNSNDLPWRTNAGMELVRVPVSYDGVIDTDSLETILYNNNSDQAAGTKRVRVVSVTGASNVLGIFNDIEKIAGIVHRHGAWLMVDAAQLVPHRRVEMLKSGIDILVFSAHKLYAPFGTGALLIRKGLIDPFTEKIISSGEENAPGIAALGKSLVLLQRAGFDHVQREEQMLTGRLLRGLSKIPGITIYGISDPDSAEFTAKGGVVAFSLKGIMADKIARELADKGAIGIRSGCHCAHLLVKYILRIPPFLQQFQRLIVTLLPGIALPGVARVSIGIGNTSEDIDRLLIVLNNIAHTSHMRKEPEYTGQETGKFLSNKEIKEEIYRFAEETCRKVFPVSEVKEAEF